MVINLSNILRCVSLRLKDLVPAVPVTKSLLVIKSQLDKTGNDKFLKVDGPEKTIIETLRKQFKRNPGGMEFSIETDVRGKPKEMSFLEKGISRKESAKKLLSAPGTVELISVSGSDGKVDRYNRKVKIDL